MQSGEYISLDIQVLDEVGNYREAVVAMNSPNQNTVRLKHGIIDPNSYIELNHLKQWTSEKFYRIVY